jgi:hypothetical protein
VDVEDDLDAPVAASGDELHAAALAATARAGNDTNAKRKPMTISF